MVEKPPPVQPPTLLQLALDVGEVDELLDLTRAVADHIDIIEIGTPLVMRCGLDLVTRVRREFPGHQVLADLKIMDAAGHEADLGFEAGADLVTILALTDDASIRDAVASANHHGGQLVADLICVTDLVGRARELGQLGVHMLAVHTGVDQQAQGRTPLGDLRELTASHLGVPIAVAGGIGVDTAPDYADQHPAVVIVGSGITQATDPVAAARTLRERLGVR